jgi:1,4-alpha-glucan branching enzyme
MQSDFAKMIGSMKRLTPRKTGHPVNFACQAPHAAAVSVVGDFNLWNPKIHPMTQRVDGTWFLQVELAHGHHRYLFHVDGTLHQDPRAQGTERDQHGQKVSIVAVS